MEFVFNGIRLEFAKKSLNLMVVLDKTDPDFKKSLEMIGAIEERLKKVAIPYESKECKFEGGRFTDSITIPIADKELEKECRKKIALIKENGERMKSFLEILVKST